MWTFQPILKTTIWGGDSIAPFKGIPAAGDRIGESWEISDIKGDESIVADGPEKGLSISQLIEKYGDNLLGKRNMSRFGGRFPLLIKFIDAREDLSVQVHPDDEAALKSGYPNGKTEMWYVIDSAPGARLANGFNRPIEPAEYEHLVESGQIMDVLNFNAIHKGDTFFIPAGRVHAIGKGAFVAEIQQTSDTTYRIYDYKRKGADGKERQLHTAEAKEVINFKDTSGAPVDYTLNENVPGNLVACKYFSTNILRLDQELMRDYSELDSFIVLIITEGECTLRCEGKETVARQGTTVLLPASSNSVTIIPRTRCTLLETCIK